MKNFFDQVDIFWDQNETTILIPLILLGIIFWIIHEVRHAPQWVQCDDCGYAGPKEEMTIKEGFNEILVCNRCAKK